MLNTVVKVYLLPTVVIMIYIRSKRTYLNTVLKLLRCLCTPYLLFFVEKIRNYYYIYYILFDFSYLINCNKKKHYVWLIIDVSREPSDTSISKWINKWIVTINVIYFLSNVLYSNMRMKSRTSAWLSSMVTVRGGRAKQKYFAFTANY